MATISNPIPRLDVRYLPRGNSVKQKKGVSRTAFLALPDDATHHSDDDDDGRVQGDDGLGDLMDFDMDSGSAPPITSSNKRPLSDIESSTPSVSSKRSKSNSAATSRAVQGTASSSPGTAAEPAPSSTPAIKKVPQFTDGYVAGKRGKASDYEDTVQALLLRGMHDYERSCQY